MLLAELQDQSNFDMVKVRILHIFNPRNVTTRKGDELVVWDMKIRDASAEGKLTLWGDRAGDGYYPNTVVEITNGWCKIYNEQVQISLGKNGKINIVDDDPSIPEE